MPRLSLFGVLLALAAALLNSPVRADEPPGRLPGVAAKVLELQKAAAAGVGSSDLAKRREALKERQAQLEKTVAELEAKPAEQLGLMEHVTLADTYQKLRRPKDALRHAQAAIALEADLPATQAILISLLAESKEVDAAEQAFAAALAACTDKAPLERLHYNLYVANNLAKRPLPAAEHLAAYLPTLRPFATPYAKTSYLRNLNEMAKCYLEAAAGAAAVTCFEKELAAWDAVQGDDSAAAREIASTIRAKQIRVLADAGDLPAAQTLLQSQQTEAQAAIEAAPDDTAAILRVASLLQAQAEIADDDQKPAQRAAWINFLSAQFKQHADVAELAAACSSAYVGEVQGLIRDQRGDDADALLKQYQELIVDVPADSPTLKVLAAAERSMKSGIRRLLSQSLQVELIGKPMIPLDATVWVNGSPQSADDLKGKVVLLDFWAVWCGPCRATFPHLTAWHEKYAKDGLVIVGLTRYYQYGWDSAAKQHSHVEDISPDDEAAALEQFAQHHQLQHRLAYMPEGSTLSESYGVSGIPHVVVIDRQGVIRMIRVGSGEKNAHDLETLLEELVHGTPACTTGQ